MPKKWFNLSVQETMEELGSNLENGLTRRTS